MGDILVRCMNCHAEWHMPDVYIGSEVRCNTCHFPFIVYSIPTDYPIPAGLSPAKKACEIREWHCSQCDKNINLQQGMTPDTTCENCGYPLYPQMAHAKCPWCGSWNTGASSVNMHNRRCTSCQRSLDPRSTNKNSVECPSCHAIGHVHDTFIRNLFSCYKCGHKFTILSSNNKIENIQTNEDAISEASKQNNCTKNTLDRIPRMIPGDELSHYLLGTLGNHHSLYYIYPDKSTLAISTNKLNYIYVVMVRCLNDKYTGKPCKEITQYLFEDNFGNNALVKGNDIREMGEYYRHLFQDKFVGSPRISILTPDMKLKIKKEATLKSVIIGAFIIIFVVVANIMYPNTSTSSAPTQTKIAPATSSDIHPSVLSNKGMELIISNNDTFDWTNVCVTINPYDNGGYTYIQKSIASGCLSIVECNDFIDRNSTRYNPIYMKITAIKISCDTPNGMGIWSGGLVSR